MYPHWHYYTDEQYLLLHIMGIDKTQFYVSLSKTLCFCSLEWVCFYNLVCVTNVHIFGLCDAYLKKKNNDQKVFDVDTIRYVVYPRYKLGFQYTVECLSSVKFWVRRARLILMNYIINCFKSVASCGCTQNCGILDYSWRWWSLLCSAASVSSV